VQIGKLTAGEIRAMSYNQLIGLVRETNRIAGGMETIVQIASFTFLNQDKKVLEVGTSTGETALALNRLVHCQVVAVDTNEESLAEARRRAQETKVRAVEFRRGDVRELDFPDEEFDVAVCGNLVSLLNEADGPRAVDELHRVTKLGGFLAAVPMYYRQRPRAKVVGAVRKAIQAPISVCYRADALRVFERPGLERCYVRDFVFDAVSEQRVLNHVEAIMERPHLRELSGEAFEACRETYLKCMLLFRKNLRQMGFTVLLARRGDAEIDPILFTASGTA
jgi:SAM-dependent methyltransferase